MFIQKGSAQETLSGVILCSHLINYIESGEDILKQSVDLFLNTMKQAQHAFGSVRSKSI